MSTPSHRPLPFSAFVVVVLATLLGVEGWTRAAWHTRDGLLQKAGHFAAEADPSVKNLVILGTCLPEQHVDGELLQAHLPPGWAVHNLGTQATGVLDWYLTLRNVLPTERIDALVIAYGQVDLIAEVQPWESRVMELASTSDLPELIEHACVNAACRADLVLRHSSATWRSRARIGNRIWASLGALTVTTPDLPSLNTRPRSDASLYYLQRLLEQVRASGLPTWMLPLPQRPEPRPPAARDPAAEAVAISGLPMLAIPQLDAALFTDETHLNAAGSRRLTLELAAALEGVLAPSQSTGAGSAAPATPGTPAPPGTPRGRLP